MRLPPTRGRPGWRAHTPARVARRTLHARRRFGRAERRTLVIGLVATATTAAVMATELGRVWRRGSAPMPNETDDLLGAAQGAVVEAARVAVSGYQDVSPRENAMFNLLASFVASFVIVRGVTFALHERSSFGPLRNVWLGERHIHHFVPGIVIAFASGATAVATRNEALRTKLALPMGAGMGLTLDESALLLDLEDVYWTREGLVSVQITLATAALMAAAALSLRFLRRGERLVLGAVHSHGHPDSNGGGGSGGSPPAAGGQSGRFA